jgi:hypothetical protein
VPNAESISPNHRKIQASDDGGKTRDMISIINYTDEHGCIDPSLHPFAS